MVKEAKDTEMAMAKAVEGSEHDLEPRKLEYSPSRKPRLAPDPPELGDTRVGSMALMAFCFVGLQASYLTWGYLQEKVMTTEYETGRFPSAAFCVFSNRVCAIVAAPHPNPNPNPNPKPNPSPIPNPELNPDPVPDPSQVVAALAMLLQHGRVHVPAPLWAFAPCSLSNSASSYGQYQALRYVSFPLQTLSKSAKIIPVMLMGKLLNGKSYPCVEYVEAGLISLGVSLFSLSEKTKEGRSETQLLGLLMLALYVVADSFTSQWQSRVYREHPTVDQFQAMFAVNTWSILMTLGWLLWFDELWPTLRFLQHNPAAIWDNVLISVTSASGQLFIYYTIRRFGPVVFTIMMTTRQMFSMVLSAFAFGHALHPPAYLAATLVFGVLFYRIKRGRRA